MVKADRPSSLSGYSGGPYRQELGVIGLGSSACKIPSRFQSESALEPYLPRQIPDSSDLRRRRGPAELALAVSGPAGGGLDQGWVKVPGSTPGKIPNPSFDLGKMTKSVVRYEAVASDPTAVWRIVSATNYKADVGQHQSVGRSEPYSRPSEEPRNLHVLIQPRERELEMARSAEDLKRITLKGTQRKHWIGAPEGNFNPPPTGHSAVPSGWGQNQLPPACLVSPNLNHLNPSHGPELAKQCSQYSRELRNQFQFQDQSKQWDPNPSNKRVLSVSTVDDDLSYSNNMKIEQMEQTKVKAKFCSVEYQPRRVPGKEILEQEAEEKQGVNESGDEDKINKDIAVKTNFVMANVPDDRWLWSTRLLWKPPPWPDFCAMGCGSVAQHGGNEVLVNFHSVKKYHISLDKAFEFNDYCRSHQPPISLIKAEVCGLFGSVFCDFGPEITILDVDGEDPHIGITDNPALVSCDDDEADFHMKQDAFLYNLGSQMLPKSYHCFSRRLMLEYSKFSSLDSDELFACKLNNPKHRDTYKQVNVHVLNYEAILWEKLPKFSMQQLYFVGLLWNLPPWPDLSFCKVYWMSMGMEMGAGTVSKRNAYDVVAGQSKNQFQPTRNKQLTDFMKEWVAMVEQYKLKDSKWSSDLYSCRKQWAPGYVNHSGRDGTSAIKKVEKPDPYFDGAVEIGGVRLGQVRNLLGRITYDFKSCAWKSGVSNSTSQWPKVTQIDIQKYTKVFGDMDRDRDGKITGAEAHTLFLSWRLPREVLKQVWVLSDQDNDGLPSTAYNVPSWQPNPGLPHKGPGAPGVPAGGMWPPLPPHLHSQIDGATRPGQPRSHIPGMVNHAAAQASKDDQSGMNSAVQEEADAPKKVEEEKQIINSIERLEYYRTKMQDLVLYKSRCDNRLNEITERALKAQNNLKSLLRGLTIAARSDKYIYSSGTASNECSSDLQGEDIKYESYAPRSTSLNTVSTIDLQKPIDHSLKDGILHLDAGAGLKMEEFWKIEIGSYRSDGEYFGPSDASTASSSATDNRRVEKVPIGIGKMELPDWAIDVTNLMNWDKGHSIIREMLDGGISLEVVTYDSIIDGMCKAQSMDKVEMLFNRMSRYVVMGDCTTHTTLVPGYYLSSILANYPVLASAPKEKGFSGFMIDVLMGGVSTAASQTAATPIERVKLLIQNQSELIKSVKLFNPYKSNGDCLARIYKETTASACSTLRKTRLATGSGLLEILLLEVLLMSAHSSLSIS